MESARPRAACVRRSAPGRSTAARARVRRSPPTATRAGAARYCSRSTLQHALHRGCRARRASISAAESCAFPRTTTRLTRRTDAPSSRLPSHATSARTITAPPPNHAARPTSRRQLRRRPGRTSDRRNRLSAGTGMPAAAGGSPRRPDPGVRLTAPPRGARPGCDRRRRRSIRRPASGRGRRHAPSRARAPGRRRWPARPGDRGRVRAPRPTGRRRVAPGIGASPAA